MLDREKLTAALARNLHEAIEHRTKNPSNARGDWNLWLNIAEMQYLLELAEADQGKNPDPLKRLIKRPL